MVTGTIIQTVLGVLEIIIEDVRKLPENIAKDVKADLDTIVRKPLLKVVELGNGKYRLW